jgi:hypothetical protein
MSGRAWALLIAACLPLGSAGAQTTGPAEPQPRIRIEPAQGPLVLRYGTRVPMKTVHPLSSKRAHQGQRFDLEVTEDVRVEGFLVIPKGSRGVGEVSRAIPKGMMGKAGRLAVRVLFVEVGGQRIRLDGQAADRGKSGLAPVVVGMPLIGIASGFFTGKSAVIPAGSAIDGYVYADLPLVRPAAPPAAEPAPSS